MGFRSSESAEPIAFYAVREVDNAASYFEKYTNPATGEVNALAGGADHGSEARVAAIIRNFCKTSTISLLSHPSLDELRNTKCKTVVVVDDFIGSGERTRLFINALWRDPTFVSWLSLKYVKIVVVAYSGTERGVNSVIKHKATPEVIIERACPTYHDMPWGKDLKKAVIDVLKRYARETGAGYWWDGYGGAMAALVFEHGCPDNVPPILWSSDEPSKPWRPLFPNRVILSGEKSVFPLEIARGDSLTTLLDVGQKKLALNAQLSRRGELGQIILIILALIAKGQRKQSAICFSTGLNRKECAAIIERCIKWGFVTSSLRITVRGVAELAAAKEHGKIYKGELGLGPSEYFPKQLRSAAHG